MDLAGDSLELVHTVRHAQSGRPYALRALFDRFQRNVMAYCLVAAGHNRELAMDLTQEVFARAFRSLGHVREPEKFAGWLFAIAGNVCRSRLAEEGRRRTLLEQLALQSEDARAGGEVAEREERIQAVREVLERLQDEGLKQIVELKYGEPEHTTRDIARKLGIPHGTVTVKLMRFRAAIRGELLRAIVDGADAKEAA